MADLDRDIQFPIAFDGEDLVREEGLDTTFFLAVYTDARNEGERGWWGNELIGMEIGSKAWVYSERGKNTTETIDNIRTEMIDAVTRQMINTGMIDDITVTYSRKEDGVVWNVTLHRYPDSDISLQYKQLWDGQIAKETNQ